MSVATGRTVHDLCYRQECALSAQKLSFDVI